MPLYDFHCTHCDHEFEQITSTKEAIKDIHCPKCGSFEINKKPSLFKIAGRGDLRESTSYHGCHPAVDHTESGHVHGPNCNHSKNKKNS